MEIFETLNISWGYGVVALIFILLDIVSGVLQSLYNKNFKSSKMREGLWRKLTLVFIIFIAVIIDGCGAIVGFDFLGIQEPIFKATTCYITIMELGSVYENISKVYPNLKIFTKNNGDNDV